MEPTCSMKASERPTTHITTTTYTDIPMYLLSFSAGTFTARVSHARKQPNT